MGVSCSPLTELKTLAASLKQNYRSDGGGFGQPGTRTYRNTVATA